MFKKGDKVLRVGGRMAGVEPGRIYTVGKTYTEADVNLLYLENKVFPYDVRKFVKLTGLMRLFYEI